MVAMGHAHTYSRTHLLNDYESLSVEHFENDMLLEPGKSFAVVSGLGGFNVKTQARDPEEWFASVYTANQNASPGALFCNLYETKGDCYFKAIDGAIPDSFTIRTNSD